MCRVNFTAPGLDAEFELKPQAALLNCLIQAVVKALPGIIQDTMACMGGQGGGSGYQPGGPNRC